MCGINGFNWSDTACIEKMNKAIRHRGPDDEGTLVEQNISLGHVRLSIIDLSQAGHQPMSNEDGSIWIVFNGEIYNFEELRSKLIEKGHFFKSRTDTEVILHAYEDYGMDCVKLFNGMWSFCIYDKNLNRLFLSRDRFGIKPLYYFLDRERFIFSSEIRGILQHGIARRPNDKIIFDFLFYNLVDCTDETFFENIRRVAPGCNLIFDLAGQELQLERYYSLSDSIGVARQQWEAREIKSLFYDSLEKMLVADVPVGSCLSGGLDSSAIVAGAKDIAKAMVMKTFSLTFPGTRIDESGYQRELIARTKVENYSTVPGPQDLIEDIYDLISAQEEPFAGTSVYGQYRVMQLAQEHGMKVLLDGQGADEILAGYHYFFGYHYFELLRKLEFLKLFKELIVYVKNYKSISPLFFLILRLAPPRLKKMLYSIQKTHLNRDFTDCYSKDRSDVRWYLASLDEGLLQSVQTYSLPHLLRFEDKNSMRFSIESRVPFLDHRFVELALACPAEAKICGSVTKYGFRKAMQNVLPESILNRKDKIGFATPEQEWLQNEAVKGFVLEVINSPSFKARPYWNWKKVGVMYKDVLSGRTNSLFVGSDIWRCLCLEIWMRVFIDEC